MFVSEPFTRFESQSVARVSVPAGLPALAAVLAVGLVLFVRLACSDTRHHPHLPRAARRHADPPRTVGRASV